MGTIRHHHKAIGVVIPDLVTIPAQPVYSMDNKAPLLFLNHYSPQVYPVSIHGLHVVSHTHRSFEAKIVVVKTRRSLHHQNCDFQTQDLRPKHSCLNRFIH